MEAEGGLGWREGKPRGGLERKVLFVRGLLLFNDNGRCGAWASRLREGTGFVEKLSESVNAFLEVEQDR